jgi:hypothetical protein
MHGQIKYMHRGITLIELTNILHIYNICCFYEASFIKVVSTPQPFTLELNYLDRGLCPALGDRINILESCCKPL